MKSEDAQPELRPCISHLSTEGLLDELRSPQSILSFFDAGGDFTSALLAAIAGGDEDLATRLAFHWSHEIDFETRDVAGRTPLILAALAGMARLARALLAEGALVDGCDLEGRMALHHAAECGHHGVVFELAPQQPDLDAPDLQNGCALWYAVEASHVEVVRQLVLRGADVDRPNHKQRMRTCLHLAAHKGHVHMVQMLVLSGARTGMRDLDGLTVYDTAEVAGHKAVLECLNTFSRDQWSMIEKAMLLLNLGLSYYNVIASALVARKYRKKVLEGGILSSLYDGCFIATVTILCGLPALQALLALVLDDSGLAGLGLFSSTSLVYRKPWVGRCLSALASLLLLDPLLESWASWRQRKMTERFLRVKLVTLLAQSLPNLCVGLLVTIREGLIQTNNTITISMLTNSITVTISLVGALASAANGLTTYATRHPNTLWFLYTFNAPQLLSPVGKHSTQKVDSTRGSSVAAAEAALPGVPLSQHLWEFADSAVDLASTTGPMLLYFFADVAMHVLLYICVCVVRPYYTGAAVLGVFALNLGHMALLAASHETATQPPEPCQQGTKELATAAVVTASVTTAAPTSRGSKWRMRLLRSLGTTPATLIPALVGVFTDYPVRAHQPREFMHFVRFVYVSAALLATVNYVVLEFGAVVDLNADSQDWICSVTFGLFIIKLLAFLSVWYYLPQVRKANHTRLATSIRFIVAPHLTATHSLQKHGSGGSGGGVGGGGGGKQAVLLLPCTAGGGGSSFVSSSTAGGGSAELVHRAWSRVEEPAPSSSPPQDARMSFTRPAQSSGSGGRVWAADGCREGGGVTARELSARTSAEGGRGPRASPVCRNQVVPGYA